MYKPYIEFSADCEHCGRLEPFTLTFFDGSTYWCRWCADTFDDFHDEFEYKDIEKLLEQQRVLKIEYYTKRIAKLERGEDSN